MDTLFIDTAQGLETLCQRLARHAWFALDTEFIRERTYYPRLCLIQVAGPDTLACIDPLALDDLGPLLDLLCERRITKVLHAAHQDLELFYLLRGEVPAPVFDTQIAATLLGHGDQIGYANLVHAMLGVELDKTQTRTDWAQRPLSEEQLRYALDDVRFLREIYPRQRTRLEALGRLAWLAADFAALSDPARYRIDPETVWQRVRGVTSLRGVQLAVVQALAAWREREAQRLDRPRRWILGDELLLDLARQRPRDPAALRKLRGLDGRIVRRYGDRLLELIREAAALPHERWPQLPRPARPSPQQQALADALMAIVRLRAAAAGVSAAALTGRKELERIAAGARETPLLRGWRAAVAGDAVRAFLDGERYLGHQEKGLTLHATRD